MPVCPCLLSLGLRGGRRRRGSGRRKRVKIQAGWEFEAEVKVSQRNSAAGSLRRRFAAWGRSGLYSAPCSRSVPVPEVTHTCCLLHLVFPRFGMPVLNVRSPSIATRFFHVPSVQVRVSETHLCSCLGRYLPRNEHR